MFKQFTYVFRSCLLKGFRGCPGLCDFARIDLGTPQVRLKLKSIRQRTIAYVLEFLGIGIDRHIPQFRHASYQSMLLANRSTPITLKHNLK